LPPRTLRPMNVGKTGEATAVDLLERQGYRIIDTNVRYGRRSGITGELDIVAWDDHTLVFIEVKTRRGTPGRVLPVENVTLAKQRQLARLARIYLVKNRLGDEETISVRFDVVTVVLAPSESGRVLRAELLKGAFIAPEGDYG
jgi:putative endonuclease